MSKTFLQLQNLVLLNCNREDKADLIKEAINLALEEIVQISPWRELKIEYDVAIAEGSNAVAIPSQVTHVSQVRILNTDVPSIVTSDSEPGQQLGYVVEIRSQKEVQNDNPDLNVASRGIPSTCFVSGGNIIFDVPLNADKIVRMLADSFVPTLEDDDDPNPLPRTDNAVVAWATSYVFRSIEMFENSREWERIYGQALRFAVVNDRRHPGVKLQMRGAMTPQERWYDPRINTYTRGAR